MKAKIQLKFENLESLKFQLIELAKLEGDWGIQFEVEVK